MKTILVITIAVVVIVYLCLYFFGSKRPVYSEKDATGDKHVFDDI